MKKMVALVFIYLKRRKILQRKFFPFIKSLKVAKDRFKFLYVFIIKPKFGCLSYKI